MSDNQKQEDLRGYYAMCAVQAAQDCFNAAVKNSGPEDVDASDKLISAADAFFLARDDLAALVPADSIALQCIDAAVQEAREILGQKGIAMSGEANTTTAGTKTYRLITPRRSM